MSRIERIEISYFRSLYKVDLRNVQDINVFSGSNDVGKSNILKALNLFFNGFTDWDSRVDFYSDINRRRLEEVRSESVKGKQIIWIAITFRRPPTYNNSLPKTIRVKKKWDRKNDERRETNLDTKKRHGDLPNSKEVAERLLTRFLNKIRFEYIPAVRGETFRLHLLNRLQNYLLEEQSENDDILKTVDKLAGHIDPKTDSLKKDFERITGITSNISPPVDITSLFQAFNVSTDLSKDHNVPLEQRGDGIQSQYLLSVLRYMCSKTKNYDVWAFEEPENSLEYSRVKKMANDFEHDCNESQIFLTTHSPALVNVDNEKSNIFRVYRNNKNNSNVDLLGQLDRESELTSDIGIDSLKSDLYEEYKKDIEKIEALENEVDKLNDLNKHKVLTEGKTDTAIIRTAFLKLRDENPPFEVRPADPYSEDSDRSASGAEMLSKFIETTTPSNSYKTIAIFDRDTKGCKEFSNLSNNFHIWNENELVKKHNNGCAYAFLLPTPSFRSHNHDITIEKMFSNEALRTKNDTGKSLSIRNPEPAQLRMDNGKSITINNDDIKWENIDNSISNDIDIKSGKKIFSHQIVPNLDRKEFREFKNVFDLIENILND